MNLRPGARSLDRIGTLAYITLELARPAGGWGRLQELSARARKASEQLADQGKPIRFVRTVFVPEDDTCLCVYEASSVDDVREAADLAALPLADVLEPVARAKRREHK